MKTIQELWEDALKVILVVLTKAIEDQDVEKCEVLSKAYQRLISTPSKE